MGNCTKGEWDLSQKSVCLSMLDLLKWSKWTNSVLRSVKKNKIISTILVAEVPVCLSVSLFPSLSLSLTLVLSPAVTDFLQIPLGFSRHSDPITQNYITASTTPSQPQLPLTASTTPFTAPSVFSPDLHCLPASNSSMLQTVLPPTTTPLLLPALQNHCP